MCITQSQKQSILALKSSTHVNDDFLSYFQSLSDINDFNWTKEPYNKEKYEFITSFINAFCTNNKIDDLANDMSESEGEKLIEIINNLSGNKKPTSIQNISKVKSDTDESKISKTCRIILKTDSRRIDK